VWGASDTTPVDIGDDELQLRVRMIRAGVGLSLVLVVLVAVWCGLTWDQPHRSVLLGLDGLALAATLVVAVLPARRIVASRHRERFFLGWSLSLIVFIAAAAAADGGARSPSLLLLFLTMTFAALTYPRRTVVTVSAASVVAVVLVARVHAAGPTAAPGPTYVVALTLTLSAVGFMCVWQARILQDQRQELLVLTRQDPLTGCLNRRGFQVLLGAGLDRVRDGEDQLSVVLIDFDGFKEVNDTLGHAAGDELLRWAAHELRSTVRHDDVVARLGGDEFALLLPGLHAAAANAVADRVSVALGPRIAISTGAATATADSTADSFLRAADRALYAAKARAGRTDRGAGDPVLRPER